MSDRSSGIRESALAALSAAAEWLERHPRAQLTTFVVGSGGAIAITLVTIGGERPVVALFSGAVFGLLYGTVTYFWADWAR